MSEEKMNLPTYPETPQELRERMLETAEHNECASFWVTASWLKTAGKQQGNPDHLSVQAGAMAEEMAELLRSLVIVSNTGITSTALAEVAAHLDACGNALKKGYAKVEINDREECLDALCDVEVTINGFAYLAKMNKPEGDRRVQFKNWDKFNEDGTPVILEGGKIGKREGWTPPDLSDLV